MDGEEKIKETGLVIDRPVMGKMDGVSDEMRRDAFTALTVAIFQEFMISSDCKYLIFSAMKDNLRQMGYSEQDLVKFSLAFNEAILRFNKYNDFMG